MHQIPPSAGEPGGASLILGPPWCIVLRKGPHIIDSLKSKNFSNFFLKNVKNQKIFSREFGNLRRRAAIITLPNFWRKVFENSWKILEKFLKISKFAKKDCKKFQPSLAKCYKLFANLLNCCMANFVLLLSIEYRHLKVSIDQSWVNLARARSRLYRRRFLQVNTHWKALAEIYTMHSTSSQLWMRPAQQPEPPQANMNQLRSSVEIATVGSRLNHIKKFEYVSFIAYSPARLLVRSIHWGSLTFHDLHLSSSLFMVKWADNPSQKSDGRGRSDRRPLAQ